LFELFFINYKSNFMAHTFKWALFSIICAVAAIFLYTTIDSEWSSQTNASIWLTILFFASATVAILCAFNAVEEKENTPAADKTENSLPQERTKSLHVKKLGGMASS
jgi:hypothetical protein